MSRISISFLVLVLLVILILLAYASTYQVSFHEVAVKVRLGKADEDSVVREPGLKFRWIKPIETIQKYDIRLRTLDTPETEIKTLDAKNVIIGSYAVWRIREPLQFFRRARSVDEAERHLRSRIAQIQATVVGQHTLVDFVNLDADELEQSYEEMLTAMRGKISETEDGGLAYEGGIGQGLLDDYGIELREIGIRRISLPQDVTQEVFKSMQQERNRIAARYREEGKSRAEAIKARAQSEADAILSFADTKAQQIKSAGYRAATSILARIAEEDREFFEWLRWLDALKAALSQKTTIFLDQDWPFFGPFVDPPVRIEGAGTRPAADELADGLEPAGGDSDG